MDTWLINFIFLTQFWRFSTIEVCSPIQNDETENVVKGDGKFCFRNGAWEDESTLTNSGTDGGWETHEKNPLAVPGPCTVDIKFYDDFSQRNFIYEYAFTKPVIIKGASKNKFFQDLTRREYLLNKYGDSFIKLSSANTYSYDRRYITFEDYCDTHVQPQALSVLGNETFYFFGDNGNADWRELLNSYNMPPYSIPGHFAELSFGVAGSGSGVPFHFHGPGFAETLWGRKRWFMYSPDSIPAFHPNRTTLQWLYDEYPKIKDDPNLFECTLKPGELIYFPDHWWHATLNLDASVFISTFLSP